MTTRPASPLSCLAAEVMPALFASLAAVPAGPAAPSRVTVFPQVGPIETRDGRRYRIDAATLVARFKADGLKLPIDLNHASEIRAPKGEAVDVIGWVTGLAADGAQLVADVEWVEPAKAAETIRRHPYVSPAFLHTEAGEATWLKSVALVPSPALAGQVALASAGSTLEETRPMKSVLALLGLQETASETAALAALQALQAKIVDPATVVAKSVHDETLAKLTATTTELTAIKAAAGKAEIEALLEQALKDKKIVPAQREHYAALCATAGIASVKSLLAASPALLGPSGLDTREPKDGADVNPVVLAAKGQALQSELAAKGVVVTISEAIDQVLATRA